ncbi:MAG TPA: hypothetical protein VLA72_05755 [Anaerolineales bacterium]|nr:hypothetical protein [Anaerolineales bacterium]
MATYRRNRLGSMFRNSSRGAAWGGMIAFALLAFEIFNFGSTQFALIDILGDLRFAGFRWASILAIAFCGIDFAGIARIFTPEQGRDEPAEVWYLFGAWFLAAVFNASLTWWGVSIAIVNHTSASGDAVISASTMTKVVPIFVAAMILLIRVLLIQTFSIAGDRLFTTDSQTTYRSNSRPRTTKQQAYRRPATTPTLRPASSINRPVNSYRPAPKPAQQTSFARPEPTYHNVSFSGQSDGDRSYDA